MGLKPFAPPPPPAPRLLCATPPRPHTHFPVINDGSRKPYGRYWEQVVLGKVLASIMISDFQICDFMMDGQSRIETSVLIILIKLESTRGVFA